MTKQSDTERIENLEIEIKRLKEELTDRMQIINHNFEAVENVLRPKKLKIPGFHND